MARAGCAASACGCAHCSAGLALANSRISVPVCCIPVVLSSTEVLQNPAMHNCVQAQPENTVCLHGICIFTGMLTSTPRLPPPLVLWWCVWTPPCSSPTRPTLREPSRTALRAAQPRLAMLDVSALYFFCTAATRLPTHEHILAMLSVSDANYAAAC